MPSGKDAEISDGTEAYDVIIIGAGAAGVGVAIALLHAGIKKFLLVDRDSVGSSFSSWPAETRFITPSFPSNSIGMLDLNSIGVGISPAFSMRVEHPTGQEFARHLQGLVEFFEVPVRENMNVLKIEKFDDLFHLETEESILLTNNVIWAGGEYQFPSLGVFEGSDLCLHTSTIESYQNLEEDDFLIIGGYESGIDAAYHLAKNNKKVSVFDRNSPWAEVSSDPSIALSTYSFERMRNNKFRTNVKLFAKTSVQSVVSKDGLYELRTEDGEVFHSNSQPILANGFDGGHKFVSHLFEQRDDGFPLLNDQDESTIVPGLFLCGPSVRHDGHIFCFIFKYRQRFAIVAEAIASSLGLETDDFIAAYRSWGMYLDDLSCCGQECLTC
jgi:putative flavoprotein involved in K+ transport